MLISPACDNIAENEVWQSLMRSSNVTELIFCTALMLSSNVFAFADDSSPISESALKSIYKSANMAHKAARDLDAEANRHAVLESWNGLFGAASPAYGYGYQNYDSFDMMPVNAPLATDFSEGNLLPPRPDVVNQLYSQLNDSMTELASECQKITIPDKANSDLKVQWSILQQQLSTAQKDQVDLSKVIHDQVILQEPFINGTRKMLADVNGIESVLKQLEKHAKHQN